MSNKKPILEEAALRRMMRIAKVGPAMTDAFITKVSNLTEEKVELQEEDALEEEVVEEEKIEEEKLEEMGDPTMDPDEPAELGADDAGELPAEEPALEPEAPAGPELNLDPEQVQLLTQTIVDALSQALDVPMSVSSDGAGEADLPGEETPPVDMAPVEEPEPEEPAMEEMKDPQTQGLKDQDYSEAPKSEKNIVEEDDDVLLETIVKNVTARVVAKLKK